MLEYGELRFTFNEADFTERCEQAALQLGFVGGRLGEGELEDLVNLAVNGEILEPASALGDHVNDCWPELVGPAERSLVHWLRRLVFRGAWLDQRVKEGELDRHASTRRRGGFSYVQPADARRRAGGEPIELAPEPSWGRGRLHAALADRQPTGGSTRASGRARLWRSPARRRSPTSSSGLSVPLCGEVEDRLAAGRGERGIERDHRGLASERARGGGDHRQRAALAQVARRRQRLARRLRVQPVEAVDQHDRVAAARGDALGGVERALDRLALGVGGGGEAERRGGRDRALLPLARSPPGARPPSTSADVELLAPAERVAQPAQRLASCPTWPRPTITAREPRPSGVSHSIASSVGSSESSARRSLRPGDRQVLVARAVGRPRRAEAPLIVSTRTSEG